MVQNAANFNAAQNFVSPYGFAPSRFSQGGDLAPTAANNYYASVGSPQNPYGFAPQGNRFSNAPQEQPSSGGGDDGTSATDFLDFSKNFDSKFNLPQSNFINDIGSTLGFGSGAVTYTGAGGAPAVFGPLTNGATQFGVGPFSPTTAVGVEGALGTSATLSSTLGAAGIGALAGGFLGKIGGSEVGGSVGGGLGAGIGFAVGGPIGGVIGGLIGGIGGGFFGGGKPATSASEFLGNTSNTAGVTGLSGISFGAKNAGAYSGFNEALSQQISHGLGGIHPYLGIDSYVHHVIRGGVNTLHSGSGQPGFIQLGGHVHGGGGIQIGFDPGDNESIAGAVQEAVRQTALRSGVTQEQFDQAMGDLALSGVPDGNQFTTDQPFIPINNETTFQQYMQNLGR